jgi:adenine-specific DNA glycosylase
MDPITSFKPQKEHKRSPEEENYDFVLNVDETPYNISVRLINQGYVASILELPNLLIQLDDLKNIKENITEQIRAYTLAQQARQNYTHNLPKIRKHTQQELDFEKTYNLFVMFEDAMVWVNSFENADALKNEILLLLSGEHPDYDGISFKNEEIMPLQKLNFSFGISFQR